MDDVAFIMKGVTSGVQFLCSHNVQHRDIKPANVLVSLEGDVKVSVMVVHFICITKMLVRKICNPGE